MIALVDCNNFYASCEQLFRPALQGRPVVVLSNNDGCVVARSAEAKALGIGMAAPWHTLKALARRHGVVALSSNYALYGDLSARIMRVLAGFSPCQEVYSIDECFLELEDGRRQAAATARQLRAEVRRLVGLPVSVGLGTTKTLAKLANNCAKKCPEFAGVCSFGELSSATVEALLAATPAGGVWGVGERLARQLAALGIHSALELQRADPDRLRQRFSVTLARTVRELNGEVCLGPLAAAVSRRQLLSSRSFGELIDDPEPLAEAVVAYATRAAEKLRRQALLAGAVGVFLRTNPFRADLPQYQPSLILPLSPTDDTRLLCQTALVGLRRIYRPGYAYQKAGVLLTELTPTARRQGELFADPAAQARSQALMTAVDRLNAHMGRGTVRLLAEGADPRRMMRAAHRSPRYTTRLDEVPVVRSD